MLRTLVVRPESIGTARRSPSPFRRGDSERIGGERRPRACNLRRHPRHPHHADPPFFLSL
ncbi:MAG: hypothetical protein VKL23_08720 [Cyanobacteriota bacterium]|nr:hypothetical protein [Cyanobacteriota bacterium]